MDSVRRWRLFRAPVALMVLADFMMAIGLLAHSAMEYKPGQGPALEGLWAVPLVLRGALLAVASPGEWRRVAAVFGVLVSLGFGAAVWFHDLVGPITVFTLTMYSGIPFLVLILMAVDGTSLGANFRRLAPFAAPAVRAFAAVEFALFLFQGFGPESSATAIAKNDHNRWVAGWMAWSAASVLTTAFLAWWAGALRASRPARNVWLLALLGTVFECVGFSIIAENTGDHDPLFIGVALAFLLGHVVTSLGCALMAGITRDLPRWMVAWSIGVCGAGLATACAAWLEKPEVFLVIVLVEAAVQVPWFLLVGRKLVKLHGLSIDRSGDSDLRKVD